MGKKRHVSFQNVESSFWRAGILENTGLQVVVHCQWCELCWKCCKFGVSNGSKMGEIVYWVKELVLKSREITIFEVTSLLGTSFGSVESILKDIPDMHQIVAKPVSCTCALCFVCTWIYTSKRSVVPHSPYSSFWIHVTSFFSQNSDGSKGRTLTDIIMIKAQLQDIPAEFQTLQFMKCFKL